MQRLTGDYPAARASLTRALRLSRELGGRHGQAWTLNQLGVVRQLTGDYPAAAASLARALQLFGDLGERAGQAGASINMGEVLFQSSAYREACDRFTQALSIARKITHRSWKQGHSKESDKARSRKETLVKAPRPTTSPGDLPAYRSPEAQRVETILLNWL